MEDKKNIVIKVRYPTSGKNTENDIHSSKVITEWNVKRILLALAGALLIIAVALIYFNRQDAQKTDLQPRTALPEKVINAPVKPKIAINSTVTRALLTFATNKNEPVGEITFPLKVSKKKSTSVYYFVELTGMKGRTVYHEWLLDGDLITRKKINISDDNKWRTLSRQLFAYTAKSNWTARVVDETGQILNEIRFNVIYE
jgi:hypothetical protein